jgi:hypothetical protein
MLYTVKITKCIKVLTHFLGSFVMFEMQIKHTNITAPLCAVINVVAKRCFFGVSFKSYKQEHGTTSAEY